MSVTESEADLTELTTRIIANDLDGLTFRGEIVDGHLVPEGLLADQAAMDAVPVGIYILETDGLRIACNQTAIDAWGRTPALGASERYCGAHQLRYPSGEVMPHSSAPTACWPWSTSSRSATRTTASSARPTSSATTPTKLVPGLN